MLLPFRNVVRPIPASDREESFRILESREEKTLINGKEIAEYFVTHPLNAELAKHTVYTKGKTPEQTGEEMLSPVDPSGGNIVLIGPMGTGKSTLGALLANRLNRPRVSVDDVRFEYYKEIGWDQEVQNKIGSEEGSSVFTGTGNRSNFMPLSGFFPTIRTAWSTLGRGIPFTIRNITCRPGTAIASTAAECVSDPALAGPDGILADPA